MNQTVNASELSLKAKLLCTLGWRMALCGAETRLIIQSVRQMGVDLGLSEVDLGLSRTGLVVKVHSGSEYSVEFKEISAFGINMSSLTDLNRICLDVSAGKLRDPKEIFQAIEAVKPKHYNQKLLIAIESLAAGLFAFLNGATLQVMACSVIGGLLLMIIRFSLLKRGFFESFAFMCSAFCGSILALFAAKLLFNLSAEQTSLALMSTSLLLVPGFPYMNGFLDIFKGYVDIGISRIIHAFVLTSAAAIGLIGTVFINTLPIFEVL